MAKKQKESITTRKLKEVCIILLHNKKFSSDVKLLRSKLKIPRNGVKCKTDKAINRFWQDLWFGRRIKGYSAHNFHNDLMEIMKKPEYRINKEWFDFIKCLVVYGDKNIKEWLKGKLSPPPLNLPNRPSLRCVYADKEEKIFLGIDICIRGHMTKKEIMNDGIWLIYKEFMDYYFPGKKGGRWREKKNLLRSMKILNTKKKHIVDRDYYDYANRASAPYDYQETDNDMAEKLNISVGAIKVARHRIKRQLSK